MKNQKDLYAVLGVPQTATLDQIKSAYRKLALKNHTDRGGDAEKMASLNNAYEVLGDQARKKNYDALQSSGAAAIDRMFEAKGHFGHLDSTGERFSVRFRKRFDTFLHESRTSPPIAFDVKTVIKPHQSTLFDLSDSGRNIKEGGLFEFLKQHARNYMYADLPGHAKKAALSPSHAFTLLIDFVEGEYKGKQLKLLYEYLSDASGHPDAREQKLYQAMANIFLIAYRETALTELQKANAPLIQVPLHESLAVVTNYIKETASFSMSYSASLLQNEYFRDVYQWALINTYWRQPHADDLKKTLNFYTDCEEARDELETLLDRQERLPEDAEIRQGFEQWVITYKYLYIYEKNSKEQQGKTTYLRTHEHHFEHAFEIMDWFPAFGERVPREILANLLLQAAVHMQIAGQLTPHYEHKMASERMSFEFYMNALMLANRASLDVELYVLQHMISNMSAYEFQHDNVTKVLPELIKRYSNIANVFPLFEQPQSHIRFFSTQDNGLQGAMRRLLYVLVDIIRHNKKHSVEQAKPFDHEYTDVLYYAYEACLRRWYEANESTESEIRISLMEELLSSQGWSFSDLNEHLQAPHIMIGRTPEGWLSPSRTLALPAAEQKSAFSALDAVEINDNNGEINFVMRDISGWQDVQQRVISFSDIQEIFSHNVQGALLSLDEVNEHMRFHPFNQIRVAPTSLFNTDFINTFLLTDYFLKFMTVGHEVNGQYPYRMRPVREMIAHLPTHLKLIIEQFQSSQLDESAHRFWIEACPVNAFLPAEEKSEDETTRIMVPEIRMIVKKHLLRRNASGALVDDHNEPDEGWHFYRFQFLPDAQRLESLASDKSVIVFTHNLREIHFIAQGEKPEKLSLCNHLTHYFVKLNAMQVDETGSISRNDENSSFLYYVVKTLCQEYKKPNLFSPEYVFAQEFTLHYNEFANCLPEFARLRELARLTVYVQLLNRVKAAKESQASRLEALLNDSKHWQERERVINKAINDINQQYESLYNDAYSKTQNSVTNSIIEFNREYSRVALEGKYRENLSALIKQIEPLSFTVHSREVIDACERMFEENKSRILNKHGRQQWNYNESHIRTQCNNEKSTIASTLTRSKREAVYNQLYEQYNTTLPDSTSVISNCVNQFLDGSPLGLQKLLVENSYKKSLESMVNSFSSFGISAYDVERALSNASVRDTIIKTIVNKNTENLRIQRDDEIQRAKGIIAEEKSELREALQKVQSVINQLSSLGIGRAEPAEGDSISSNKCTWVPASVDRHENRTRLVYGGVHVQPNIHVETRMNQQAQTAVNQCYQPSNHYRYSAQDLPRANQDGYSNNYHQRMSAPPSAPPPSGGSGGAGYGGGRRPPSPPPPGDGYSTSMSNALRHNVVLSFQQAGILRQSEKLTQQAISGSERIVSGRELKNTHVVASLTAGGKNIDDWAKYTTQSVSLSTGQSVQIHFYKHEPTGKVSNIEYKVKGVVDYAARPSASERTGPDPYRGTSKSKYASELF